MDGDAGGFLIPNHICNQLMRTLDRDGRAVWIGPKYFRTKMRRQWATEDRRKGGARKRRKWGM